MTFGRVAVIDVVAEFVFAAAQHSVRHGAVDVDLEQVATHVVSMCWTGSKLGTDKRALARLAGDVVTVAVDAAIGGVPRVAALEVRHRRAPGVVVRVARDFAVELVEILRGKPALHSTIDPPVRCTRKVCRFVVKPPDDAIS